MSGQNVSKRKRPSLNSSQPINRGIWHSTPIQDDTNTEEVADDEDHELIEEQILGSSKRQGIGQGVLQGETSEEEDEEEDDFFVGIQEKRTDKIVEDEDGNSFIQSQRFGPVVINPPSGHIFFAFALSKNGFILSQPNNHLRVDAVVFRKNLEDWLNLNNDENSRIENDASKFLTAINQYLVVKQNLHHSLTITLNESEYLNPPLLHCLLGVPFLQPHVLKLILPIIAEASSSNSQEDIDLVASLMKQMKWLPILVNGKSLANGLMDILENATADSQKQMICLLPEIFLPEFHTELVPKLLTIFDMGTQVNVVILDCFASLEIPEANCIDIRCKAVDHMSTAPLVELPAYFSFLFRLGSLSHLQEGINEMREKLEIKSKRNDSKNAASQCEILERIRFCVSVNGTIIKLWISKIKDDLNCDIGLKTLDLIMLLVFAESADKSALATLRALFETNGVVCRLFDNLMEYNKAMVFELFPALAKFLDAVLRTKDSKGHAAASEITWKLFVGLGPLKSQHLTSNLIGVIINGHPRCRNVALNIFTKIAETDPIKLLYFHNHLMGALVYVTKFPPRQMQALMNVLAILANVPKNVQGQTNTFTIEFMILLRKQLTHTSLQTRCFGILGALAAVRQLASHSPVDEEKINELLHLTWSSTERDEEACTMFFDELSSCASILPKKVCLKFRDILMSKFENTWIMEQASESQLLRISLGQAGLELIPTFDANKDLQSDSLIVIFEPKVQEMSPLVVPSHLKIMVELEKVVEDGALEGVDTVIGCPVLIPNLKKYFEQDSIDEWNVSQRLHLGQYLALVTNFFRECVSAFTESSKPELRLKVWQRFNDIITLQKIWASHLYSFSNLPIAYGAEKTMESSSTSSGPGFSGGFQNAKSSDNKKKLKIKPRKKKAKATKKQKKNEDEEDEVENQEEPEEEEEIVSNLDLENLIQPKKLTPYLRHLDSKIFNLIKYPLKLTKKQIDFSCIISNMSDTILSTSTMDKVERFNLETLSFLLIELKTQALDKHKKLDILSVTAFLPSICSHVDVIASGKSTNPTQHPQMDTCLRLLISSTNLYFEAIKNLQESDHKTSLIEASVVILASRYMVFDEEADEELPTKEQVLDKASKYIGGFCNFVGLGDPLTANEHVKLLKTIHDLLPMNDTFKTVIDGTVKVYLRRDWKIPTAVIDYFLKTWFAVTPHFIETVKSLTTDLTTTNDKPTSPNEQIPIPNCSKYKSCSTINFHIWYAALFAGLAQHVHKLGRRKGEFEYSYNLWNGTIDVFKSLIFITQQIQQPKILLPLLRHSRVYIEAFISGGVWLIPEIWRTDLANGKIFTRCLQTSTRRIQMICEHSKVIKDNNLMRYVPQMKKQLETLVYRVRQFLTKYGAANAFSIGSLKHKDLNGMEMSSQPFKHMEQGSSDSEDMLETVYSEKTNSKTQENSLEKEDDEVSNEYAEVEFVMESEEDEVGNEGGEDD